MDVIDITLENCHGISKLKTQELNFSKKSVCLIYAPNGTMKTSFANTFNDLCNNIKPLNKITNNSYNYKIKIKKNMNDKFHLIKSPDDFKKNIFVVKSMDENYNFNHVSKLLVNENLKKKYDDIYNNINKAENALIKILAKKSGLKKDDLKDILLKDFNKYNFLELLFSLMDNHSEEFEDYSYLKYNELFNDKTQDIWNNDKIMNNFKKFSSKYMELLSNSLIFRDNFTHNNLEKIAKDLDKNNFFEANHKIILNNENNLKERKLDSVYSSSDELIRKINQEKNKIFANSEIKKVFDSLDKTFEKNGVLKKFRDVLTNNPLIISKILDNEVLFKQKLWKSYIFDNNDEYVNLIKLYECSKLEINSIIEDAKKEHEIWKDVINLFNERFFSFPFNLEISNQQDVILNNEIPVIQFIYKKDNTKKKTHSEINEFLSSGEKRAIYILNILFNLKVQETDLEDSDINSKLLIIDDIADSFDYQNKYAIIEYLKDISENDKFKMIILTHNFDFFRTVKSRLNTINYFAVKKGSEISFKKDKLHINPVKRLCDSLNEKFDNKTFLVLIPFIRNIMELQGKNNEFEELTKLLHIKSETKYKTVNDFKDIYCLMGIKLEDNLEENIYNMIKKEAEIIHLDENNTFEVLKNKIILSIAIRLLTEEFILNKISDETDDFHYNQTYKLIDLYMEKYDDNYEVFERVKLMTSENIHVNSFMYEPLIDMDDGYLMQLYRDIKGLK